MKAQNFIHSFICVDNELVEIENNSEIVIDSNLVVYEVFRVLSEKALFIEDHLERMKKSLHLTGIDFKLEYDNIKNQVAQLCDANQVSFGNIEFRVVKYDDEDIVTVLGFIPHQYPAPVKYIEGIDMVSLQVERDNPQAKVKNTSARILSNELLARTKVYEVLLINHDGLVTEGSRSNIFIIKNNQVFTAPDEMVLSGISRKYVITVIEQLKLPLVLQALPLKEVYNADAVLLCGTSPGVIPVKMIDNKTFTTNNPLAKQIMHSFGELVSRYIRSNSI